MIISTLPNLLTLGRIALIPILVAAFYTQTSLGRWIAAIVFISACLTDYLDGYVARAWSQTSRLGQFLDPIADKLLVASTLLLLAGFGRISTYSLLPAIVILCREIMVSGLREFLSDFNVTVPVTRLAQFKTANQMIGISLLLLADASFGQSMLMVGEGMLWVAAVMTLFSGYDYLRIGFKHL